MRDAVRLRMNAQGTEFERFLKRERQRRHLKLVANQDAPDPPLLSEWAYGLICGLTIGAATVFVAMVTR